MSKPLLPARPLPGPLLVVSLTPVQRQNLLGFLQRATLSGREAQAFNEVFDLVQRAVPAAFDGAPRQLSQSTIESNGTPVPQQASI